MQIRYPVPLVAGDRIGVTAPSSGVGHDLRARLDVAVTGLRRRGFEIELGDCLDGSTHVSAPAHARAAELMRMLVDPSVRAVIPPWGGETGIDLIPLLDFEAIAAADPTWLVGFSDLSTLLVPITLLAGWATLHGANLMDTPYDSPSSVRSWVDVAGAASGSTIRQSCPGVHRVGDWDDWTIDAEVTRHTWNGRGRWSRIDGSDGPVDVTGRLIGGCVETIANLTGTRYADASSLGEDGPLIVYVEAAEDSAYTICRSLHGMRLAGFFDFAVAVLVGRTRAPDSPSMSQQQALVDALGALGVPLIADVECGHVPPQMPIVNGAIGRVLFDAERCDLEQTLA